MLRKKLNGIFSGTGENSFFVITSDQPDWDPNYDISEPNDGVIDYRDLDMLFNQWLRWGRDNGQISKATVPNGGEQYGDKQVAKNTQKGHLIVKHIIEWANRKNLSFYR